MKLSRFGIGTLTFGSQTSKAEAHRLLSYTITNGIRLIDCAEIYPHYPSARTYGLSEAIVGDIFLTNPSYRREVTLCTKLATNNPIGIGASKLSWIRGGAGGLAISRKNILAAVDASLTRLKTDYIDLYQVHWPARDSGHDRLIHQFKRYDEAVTDQFGIIVEVMNELIKMGKIANYGLCNETPWGLMKILSICERGGHKRPITLQTPFSLLNRRFESSLREVTENEGIMVISYGTLAGGLLSGKYLEGKATDDSRYRIWPGPDGKYFNHNISAALKAYLQCADSLGLTLSELAYHFVKAMDCIDCTLIGARNVQQLESAVSTLSQACPNGLVSELTNLYRTYQDVSLQ